jgi:DNA-3-methyladenine glycosylase II
MLKNGPMSRDEELAAADAALSAADLAMARLVERHGPSVLAPRRLEGGHFGSLAGAILFQQLAQKAAAAIHGRFLALFDGAFPSPQAVVAMPEATLRGAGLSANKAAAIRDLAERIVDGRLRLDAVATQPDAAIIAELCDVRGIGQWTGEMFLIFTLGRLDVWPVDDYGVRKGYARAHGLAALPRPKELGALGEIYRPWRSVAAWYCWRAAEDKDQLTG